MVIYTDGSCCGNGKATNSGGFGVVVLDNDENLLYTYSKRRENTTNNREELKAILYTMLNHGVKTEVYEFSQVEMQTIWLFLANDV